MENTVTLKDVTLFLAVDYVLQEEYNTFLYSNEQGGKLLLAQLETFLGVDTDNGGGVSDAVEDALVQLLKEVGTELGSKIMAVRNPVPLQLPTDKAQ